MLMNTRFLLWFALLSALALGCTSEPADPSDTGTAEDGVEDTSSPGDTRVAQDTAQDTQVATDTGSPQDTGSPDLEDTQVAQDISDEEATAPEPMGSIEGLCDLLDNELTEDAPFVVDNAIDFGSDPFDDPEDVPRLSEGAQYILSQPNAGGSSVLSEVFAYEVLDRCEMASLIKTETEIVYPLDYTGSITDILVSIDGLKIGVSVTRAFNFNGDPYTVDNATTLLEKKLAGINESSLGVTAEDAWAKQILFVMAFDPDHIASLQTAFEGLDATLRSDTVLYITATEGEDAFLY